MPKTCCWTSPFLACRGMETQTLNILCLHKHFAILLFLTPNLLLLFKPIIPSASLFVNSMISVTPAWIPMPNISTFCFPTGWHLHMTGQGHSWLWPPRGHCQRQHGPWGSHVSDTVCLITGKQPTLITGKTVCYLHPPIWGSSLYRKVYHGHGKVCLQYHQSLLYSVWPAPCGSYLGLTHSGLSRLFFGSWYESTACFVNSFVIVLCLDS